MDAKQLINVIVLNQGKVKIIETKEDGHQVMTGKNDIIGYISDQELRKAVDLMLDEIATSMLDLFADIYLFVKKLHDNESHKGGKYDA